MFLERVLSKTPKAFEKKKGKKKNREKRERERAEVVEHKST